MKIKRIGAFLIDMFFVSLLSSFILLIPVFNYNSEKQNSILTDYFDKIISSDSVEIDREEMVQVMYDYAHEGLTLNIVSTTMIFLYFGIAGYLNDGVTIGKKIMKIKVVPNKGKELNPSLYILREVLLLGILFKIIGIITMLLLKNAVTWYNVYNIINDLSMIINLVIYGFILFRDDGRGLHDLICNTKVISINQD